MTRIIDLVEDTSPDNEDVLLLAKVSDSGKWRKVKVSTLGGGSGGMEVATYDPQGIGADAFVRTNHTGTQPQSTITDLVAALASASVKIRAKGTLTTDIANGNAILEWATPTIANAAGEFGAATYFEALVARVFTFGVQVQINGATSRQELTIDTEIRTAASGSWTASPDDTISDYVARDSNQDVGAVFLYIHVNMLVGDRIRFRASSDSDGGNANLQPAGTRINIT